MTIYNKISFHLVAFVMVCALLAACGTVEPQPTQKQDEKQVGAEKKVDKQPAAEKPIQFSFDNLPEYEEITTENPLIKKISISLPANAATESVECKISLFDSILWTKKIDIKPSDKEQKISIDVDPYQPPKIVSLPANYIITGLSNIGIETSMPVKINDPDIITRMLASDTFASTKTAEFITEYGKTNKIKHSFASSYLVAIMDEKDQLDFYLFDYPISQDRSKIMFSKVGSYDCKGFEFLNNITFKYNNIQAKNRETTEYCFFKKGNKFFAVAFGHPFSGYLESWGEDTPMLEYDSSGKPFRLLPEIKVLNLALEKLSETKTVVIFGNKQISYIFDKARGIFSKIEAKPMP